VCLCLRRLGLDLVHVPFGGGGPAVAAVVAGHTPISFGSPQAAMQHVREGTVRALAVTSKARSQIFPDVPSMTEVGYPQIEGDSWVGILVPAGTPRGDYRGPLPRERQNPRAAGHEGAARRARLRPGREHAEGVRNPHGDRDRDVGQGDPSGQHQAAMTRMPNIGTFGF
jgi:Tripartite tricarboxylate transporter family receptor